LDVPTVFFQDGDAMAFAGALEAHDARSVLRVSADVAQHACWSFMVTAGAHSPTLT
jgi:hypothetical protein